MPKVKTKPETYDATVSYDAVSISLIDRNVMRIAENCDGRHAFDSSIFNAGICTRELLCVFKTKLKRLRFIQEMRRFIKDSDFGVTVRVGEVKK